MNNHWAHVKTTGGRVKELARQENCKREEIAKALGGYAPNSITRFYNGTQKFSDEQLEKLAAFFGVQVGFLKCETDYETVEDMFLDVLKQDVSDTKDTLTYLKKLGLTVTAKLYFVGSGKELYQTYFDIESVLSDETKEKLQSYEIPSRDKYKKYLESKKKSSCGRLYCDELYVALAADAETLFPAEMEFYRYYVELTAGPNDGLVDFYNGTAEITDIEKNNNSEECINGNESELSGLYMALEKESVLYSVQFKDKFLGLYEPENLNRLFGLLDSVCTAAIDSILGTKRPIIEANTSRYSYSTIV